MSKAKFDDDWAIQLQSHYVGHFGAGRSIIGFQD